MPNHPPITWRGAGRSEAVPAICGPEAASSVAVGRVRQLAANAAATRRCRLIVHPRYVVNSGSSSGISGPWDPKPCLPRLKGMNRLWIAAPLAAAALALTACSGLASEASTPASDAVAPPAGGTVTESVTRGAPAADTQPDRDVIRTATVSLIVAQPDQSVEELQRIAVASDGYLPVLSLIHI